MAHSYSHLYDLIATGMRFFTVYGLGVAQTWLYFCLPNRLASEPIQVFNNGKMVRDFTYIDDIIESLVRVLDKPVYPILCSTPQIQTQPQVGRRTGCSILAPILRLC